MARTRIKFRVEQEDLQILQDYLRKLGCEDVGVVDTAKLRFSESVRRKCEYPNCGSYGNTFQCPPFTPKKELMASCIPESYEYGVVGVIFSPSEAMASPRDGNILGTFANAGVWSEKLGAIVGKALYDGTVTLEALLAAAGS